MKFNKLGYAMIRAAVEKGIADIRENPERGVRNLVELGAMYARGRYQQDFFTLATDELQKPDSAYFKLVERVAREVDADILTAFGMNLGYNGFTYGASLIREIESLDGFNVPWALSFELGSHPGDPGWIEALLGQGKALGIFCYLFRVDDGYTQLPRLLDLLEQNGDCAYTLLLPPGTVTGELADRLCRLRTVLPVLWADGDEAALTDAVALLRSRRCMFGGYVCSEDALADPVGALERAAGYRLPLLLYINKSGRPFYRDDRPEWLDTLRLGLAYPVFPIALPEDVAAVDRNISSEACVAVVDGDGVMTVVSMEDGAVSRGHDLRQTPLRAAFAAALPKKTV